MTFIAHIDKSGNYQSLEDHLKTVGTISKNFSDKFNAGSIGYSAGVLHDLGKYRKGFQEYIKDVTQVDGATVNWYKRSNEKTHSAAGAIFAYEKYKGNVVVSRALQHTISGHHSGLKDWKDVKYRIHESNNSKVEYNESVKNADQEILNVPAIENNFQERNIPFLIRMIFSCLVDADSLDTEAFMNPFVANIREKEYNSIPELYKKLRTHLREFDASKKGTSDATVTECRNTIRKSCDRYASNAPGFFTLETPTGGGKTLSSVLFALKHAKKYNKDRIIYAIPFTSIIEQTASIFKDIFDDGGFHNVVEHHSQYSHSNEGNDDFVVNKRVELSTENWDAPIIVTTNVQFFESLFASKRSTCRKLHNIANSVIILDEAQQIPIQYLQPFIKALKILVEEYGVTVVFCTATQPNLDSKKDYRNKFFVFDGIDNMTDIIKKPEKLFHNMKRTDVRMLGGIIDRGGVEFSLVAEHIALSENSCSLTIVSTKDQAQELYDLVVRRCGSDGVYHLSNRMCGVHKMQVINHIKERLKARRESGSNEPIRVISTTLIEAGVDIDFPVVFKAIAGIDSIAQAAGRCNREGFLDVGKVWVFIPKGYEKFAAVKVFADDAIRVIKDNKELDIIDLENVKEYFQELKRRFGKCDSEDVIPLMVNQNNNQYNFETMSEKVKIIKTTGKTVIVDFDAKSIDMIKQLEENGVDFKLMRSLQGYIINVLPNTFTVLQNNGIVKEAFPGSDIYILSSVGYTKQKGLVF